MRISVENVNKEMEANMNTNSPRRRTEALKSYNVQDYKQIMCSVYCKSYVSGDAENTTCDSCALNPKYRINFELGSNVKALSEIGVLHDGSNLIQRYQKEEVAELFKRFLLLEEDH